MRWDIPFYCFEHVLRSLQQELRLLVLTDLQGNANQFLDRQREEVLSAVCPALFRVVLRFIQTDDGADEILGVIRKLADDLCVVARLQIFDEFLNALGLEIGILLFHQFHEQPHVVLVFVGQRMKPVQGPCRCTLFSAVLAVRYAVYVLLELVIVHADYGAWIVVLIVFRLSAFKNVNVVLC